MRYHVENSEEGYRFLAENMDIPVDEDDIEARIVYVKTLIKSFVDL